MADLNLGHLISKFVNYQALNAPKNTSAKPVGQTSFTPAPSSSAAQTAKSSLPAP